MAKPTYNDDADWQTLDATKLPDDLLAAYELYTEAALAAREAKKHFEDSMSKAATLPKGKRLIFGYRFGKLSIAIVDAADKPAPKPAAPKQSLSEWLAANALR